MTHLRRALLLALPAVVATTLVAGIVYAAIQHDLRSSADDPQVQIAEDAARALSGGATAANVVGGFVVGGSHVVDIEQSLATHVAVLRRDGVVLASTARLDGSTPVPPPGVIDSALRAGEDVLTWQPRPGVRVASVAVPYHAADGSGVVFVGRSLRLVEQRVDEEGQTIAFGWIVTVVSIVVAAWIAAWKWPNEA